LSSFPRKRESILICFRSSKANGFPLPREWRA